MKIKSIKKTGPGLYLITYAKRFWQKKCTQRFAIQRNELFKDYGDDISMSPNFDFRDNGSIVDGNEGSDQLCWMVKNDVESYDDDKEKA